MATVKFLNAAGKHDDPAARDDVIRYITQKVKTPSPQWACPMVAYENELVGGFRILNRLRKYYPRK